MTLKDINLAKVQINEVRLSMIGSFDGEDFFNEHIVKLWYLRSGLSSIKLFWVFFINLFFLFLFRLFEIILINHALFYVALIFFLFYFFIILHFIVFFFLFLRFSFLFIVFFIVLLLFLLALFYLFFFLILLLIWVFVIAFHKRFLHAFLFVPVCLTLYAAYVADVVDLFRFHTLILQCFVLCFLFFLVLYAILDLLFLNFPLIFILVLNYLLPVFSYFCMP